MIVLDTNVLSEMMKPSPDPRVRDWLDAQPQGSACLTAISVGELRFGLAILPQGRRRDALTEALERVLGDILAHAILPYDEPAAREYAGRRAVARSRGIAVATADAMIAAIAAARGLAVASRDAAPFAAMGIAVIDPWMG